MHFCHLVKYFAVDVSHLHRNYSRGRLWPLLHIYEYLSNVLYILLYYYYMYYKVHIYVSIPCVLSLVIFSLSGTFSGEGSTDLRLYTSIKLKNLNCWLYSPMHKKLNLYFNNFNKLYFTKIYFSLSSIFNCEILMY